MTEALGIVAEAAKVAAWPQRRLDTAHRITRAARRLAARQGFDEFTLDDLAAAADVSRRTLFNYFDGKMQAVLGLPPASLDDGIAVFVDGGPTGDLLHDALHAAGQVVVDESMTRQDWADFHHALERNPKVLAAAVEQFRRTTIEMRGLIARREGISADDPRADLTVSLVLALYEATVRSFVADENDRPLDDIFRTYLTTLGELASSLDQNLDQN